MTKGELKRERMLEKARARVVKAEIARSKREEKLRQNLDAILDWMSLILVVLIMFSMFFVEGFGFGFIPKWVYVIGIVYLIVYLWLTKKRWERKN